MYTIYTDASTQGNLGPCGVGITILHNNSQIQLSIPLNKHYTNHQAEFIAQIISLQYLYQNFNISDDLIFLNSDSKLVVSAIQKNHVNDKFQDLFDELTAFFNKNPNLFIKWIPESKNKGADNLARQALRKALKNKVNTDYSF